MVCSTCRKDSVFDHGYSSTDSICLARIIRKQVGVTSKSVLELTSIPAKNKSLAFLGDHVLLG